MKFDALRSSVARLFETAATLVAPQGGALEGANAPPDGLKTREDAEAKAEARRTKAAEIEDAIRMAMPGADVHVKVIGGGEDITDKIIQDIAEHAKRDGVKPPPEGAYPWSTWTAQMTQESLHSSPGWSFCRIGNRKCSMSGNPDDDTAEFVFGFVRGSFGIFRRPFDVCEFVDGDYGAEIKEDQRLLTCITHLRSGVGMGLFADMKLAAEACELVDRAGGIDWNATNPNIPESFGAAFNQVVSTWKIAGIRIAPLTHAHVKGADGEESPPIPIFERTEESMHYGRPEKLS